MSRPQAVYIYGFTVRLAVRIAPLYEAVIVTLLCAETADVVIVKLGDEVAPAATVTLAGGTTPGSLLDRFTTVPPAGAGPFSVTLFNVVEAPPVTDAGDSVIDSSANGFTVRVAVFITPL